MPVDTIDQGVMAQAFKYSGTKIITPLKVYDPANEFDEEYFEFGLFMSRREYKTIKRRLVRGRNASAKEGKWVSGLAPYGYERVRIKGDKGWTLRPVEEQADIVRFIFKLYTSGEEGDNGEVRRLGTYTISKRLDSLGVAPPSSAQYWNDRTVQCILQNPAYIALSLPKFLENEIYRICGSFSDAAFKISRVLSEEPSSTKSNSYVQPIVFIVLFISLKKTGSDSCSL